MVMRAALAVLLVVAFGALAAFATAARGPVAAPPAVRPLATAVPGTDHRVDPEELAGRLAVADRASRRMVVLDGFRIPVDGIDLPSDPELWPGSARDYRAGSHEGIDFPAKAGTPVHAAKAGVIVRIDRDFLDWGPQERAIALDDAVRRGYTPEGTLDRIRGRQVWIDHGAGIVTRYAHLSAVEPLTLGTLVERGQLIGAVGSSGFPEGGPHLHLEIRVGDGYFGDGLAGDLLGRVLARAFDPSDSR